MAPSAAEVAEALSRECGLDIVRIADAATAVAAANLLRDIWRTPHGWPVPPEMLLVLGHTGNYAVTVYQDGALVAASAGLRTGDPYPHLHSHITGVAKGSRGRNVGYAVKLHQRAWALSQGIRTITWTFDPLHRRNAAFNLARLGTRFTRYLPDFYGAMTDEVNRGTPSDRALMDWDLLAEVPAQGRVVPNQGAAGPPAPLITLDIRGRPAFTGAVEGTCLSIVVPHDVEELRRTDPERAGIWVAAVGAAFQSAFTAGYSVVGFDPDRHYLLTRSESHAR